jgi:hypothetical protein
MKKLFLFFIFVSLNAWSQDAYFFPKSSFNELVPSPKDFLGYDIGNHHTRYDKLVEYMYELQKKSDRVKVTKIGETNEHREQIIVHFAKPELLSSIENIRKNHLEAIEKNKKENGPVVVWLGYNVHGNEASGGEASLLTAYYLAASKDPEVIKWLDNAVFLMEPIVNPDGRDRFNNWVNMHKGIPFVTDPNDREHNEIWPSGRVNHYWFDLNRDWYLAVHKETRNRLAYYHQWLPNVVTDFHEMGTNSTHFFEPTKSNAENPLVPAANYKTLNTKFAKYFEKAMNEIGSFYYTKESFDNFYPGYGSSYPDMQGGLGLLFEQASSRGHAQDSQNGVLTYKFAVRNQLVNALATIRAAVDEKELLQNHQSDFFKNVINDAKKSAVKGYLIGDAHDMGRNRYFWDFLLQHKIKAYHLEKDQNINGATFSKDAAIFIPYAQAQNLLVRSIFDKPKKFADSIFYDTSAWNLALAYGLKHAELNFTPAFGKEIDKDDLITSKLNFEKSNYAYLIDWREYNAAKLLNYLLNQELRIKVAMKEFTVGGKAYPAGTLLVPIQNQKQVGSQLFTTLKNAGIACNVPIDAVNTGFAESGIDLGSNLFKTIETPKALMVVGTGTSQYEAGEVWHLLETKLEMPVTKVELSQFNRVNLYKYTHLILVSGSYESLDVEAIKNWITAGGNLIAQKTASEWAIKNKLVKVKTIQISNDNNEKGNRISFENYGNLTGAKTTGGAIFETELDLSHPLAFGYTDKKLAIYRNNNTLLEAAVNTANNPGIYSENSWICGYVHPEILKKINKSASIVSENVGNGRVILFSDNPNFRGTWFSTNKLFFNALFFSSTMGSPRFGNAHEE